MTSLVSIVKVSGLLERKRKGPCSKNEFLCGPPEGFIQILTAAYVQKECCRHFNEEYYESQSLWKCL